MPSSRRQDFPLNWKLIRHILSLYRDVNLALQELSGNPVKSDVAHIFERIINRLKAINTLGDNVSWYFFLYMQLNLHFLRNSPPKTVRQLKRFLVSVRNSLEKMIVSKGNIRLLRRKDIFIDLKNPTISLFVPDGFEDYIPGYRYIPGTVPVLLTAPHAMPPMADTNTGRIATIVAKKTSAYALISTIPRFIADHNRVIGRVWPFRRILENLVINRRIKLIIDLHATSRTRENLIEIGTWYGFSISKRDLTLLMRILDSKGISYGITSRFVGGDIIFYHSNIPIVGTIQLEISRGASKKEIRKIIRSLIEFINKLSGARKRWKNSLKT